RPFNLNKFDYYVDKKWPRNVIRAKGVCYFSDNTDVTYLFEQAGVQKKITDVGQWYATAPEEELQQLMEQEPGLMRDWDDIYGDRMEKIVFIGQHLDREQITRDLDACLD
ncbi:MAG: GTP-binding protein, partial [Muribaculaceae bacterium]